MRDKQNGLARRTESTAEPKDLLLIDDVQARRRLIEEEHGCLLGEHLCEQNALPLSPRHGVQRLFRKLEDTRIRHTCLSNRKVVRLFLPPPREIGIAPREHDVARRVVERHLHMLLQICRAACECLRIERPDVLAHQEGRAGELRENAAQCLEKRALARAVRPDQPDHLTCAHAERHICEDDVPVVARIECFRTDHFVQMEPPLFITRLPKDAHPRTA